jgi:hypothetical protein
MDKILEILKEEQGNTEDIAVMIRITEDEVEPLKKNLKNTVKIEKYCHC